MEQSEAATSVQVSPPQGPDAVEAPVGAVGGREARYGSDRMLDLLRELGCSYLPSNPGSSFRGLHDSIVQHGANRSPQLLLCHNEQIAVSVAHGYAKAAQRTGFAVVHDLVGLMQASMGVYNAFLDEVPLVLLGGGGPADTTERRPIDWIHSASAQTALVRDYVKWDAEPLDLRGTEESIAQAVRIAATPPHGPVYVTLDSAVQEQPLTDGDNLPSVALAAQVSAAFALDPDEADEIAQILLAARFPVIAVGPMGYAPAATHAVVALADALDAAVLDVELANVVPSDHPLNMTGKLGVLRDADVVLAIGVRDLRAIADPVVGRSAGTVARDGLGEGVTVIDIGLRDLILRGWSNAGASSPRASRRLVADPVRAARTLAAAVEDRTSLESPDAKQARKDRRAAVGRAHDAVIAAGEAAVRERWNDARIAPSRIVKELWDTVQDVNWVMALRNTRTFPTGIWRFRDANDFLGHSGGGGVGYGPGGMVGAALGALETGRLAVGIAGDGDVLMHPGALWTAVHYRIPMLLVINDNSSFYNDESHQVTMAKDRGWPQENGHIGMRMEDPQVDIAALARGYGAWAAGPIEKGEDLAAALRDGLEAAQGGETAIVHVRAAPF